MIVIDASAMIEVLVGRDPDASLFEALAGPLSAPHHLDVEVLSVLRGLVLGRKIDVARADGARAAYFDLAIDRYETAPLAERIWALRHSFTSYDAAYVALAEGLAVPLVTCDAKLVAGHRGQVRLVARSG